VRAAISRFIPPLAAAAPHPAAVEILDARLDGSPRSLSPAAQPGR
jgi:hypothetical protein